MGPSFLPLYVQVWVIDAAAGETDPASFALLLGMLRSLAALQQPLDSLDPVKQAVADAGLPEREPATRPPTQLFKYPRGWCQSARRPLDVAGGLGWAVRRGQPGAQAHWAHPQAGPACLQNRGQGTLCSLAYRQPSSAGPSRAIAACCPRPLDSSPRPPCPAAAQMYMASRCEQLGDGRYRTTFDPAMTRALLESYLATGEPPRPCSLGPSLARPSLQWLRPCPHACG